MTNKIIDYSKLTPELLELLTTKFPLGYDNSDIIKFKNAAKEMVEAVRIETDDTIYLVKVGKKLIAEMEAFMDDDDDNDDNTPDEIDLDGVDGD
ncbi:MAG: DNA-directed RNA polymerase subunit delta [Sphingobacteriales bacterium]|jgi:DNA-directed RNA polymerase subunit delta